MLHKDEWLQLDAAVLRAARMLLRAWQDLAHAHCYGSLDLSSVRYQSPGIATEGEVTHYISTEALPMTHNG